MKRVDRPRRPRREGGPRISPVWFLMFVVALVLRVAYAWVALGPDATPSSDPATYDTVAWNLARGAGFSLGSGDVTRPTAFVPPVLPWLTSLLYRLIGHQYFAAVLLQCAIGALVPLVLAAFAGAMFGGTVARWSGWIAAVHPLLVFFSGYLLTESLFGVAMLVALVLSAEWIKTPRGARALGTGIAWGLAALVRPTALTLPLVVALWAWRPLGLTVGPRGRASQIALLVLGLVLTVGPWTIRNGLALGAFVPVTTGGGGALLVSNNPDTWDVPEQRGGASSASYHAALSGEFRGLGEVEVDARARARAWAFMRGRVEDWPAIAIAKLARLWRINAREAGTGSWQRADSPLDRLGIDPLFLWSIATLPFAIWGVIRTLRGARRWFQALPLLVVVHFSLLAVVFFGSLRMRVPIEPMMALFIALGLEDVRRRLRARRQGLRVIPGAASADR